VTQRRTVGQVRTTSGHVILDILGLKTTTVSVDTTIQAAVSISRDVAVSKENDTDDKDEDTSEIETAVQDSQLTPPWMIPVVVCGGILFTRIVVVVGIYLYITKRPTNYNIYQHTCHRGRRDGRYTKKGYPLAQASGEGEDDE